MFATFILCLISIYVAAHSVESADKRIVGGIPSVSSTWPMIVSIRQKNLQETLKWMNVPFTSESGHFCGGSIIDSDWVVTAASCFPDRDVQNLLNEGRFNYVKVRKLMWLMRTMVRRMKLDNYKVCLDESCSRWSAISNIIIHPGYLISIGRDSPGFDIALVKLANPVGEFMSGIISKSESFNGNKSSYCKSAGWGVRDLKDPVNSGEFREFDVDLVDPVNCKPFIKRLELCGLGEKNEDKRSDFCFFDGGGPLMCRNTAMDSEWQLIGLISRGTREICGDPDQRGIYTDVSAYADWINSVMQRQ